MDHLETVWNRFRRTKVTTQKQFDLTTRQDQIEEKLCNGNEVDSWKSKKGDMTVFLTDHLHRGASSRGKGYAYFCAWEVPQNKVEDTHTDGLPVHWTNWKVAYTEALQKIEKITLAQRKLKMDASRAARAGNR
jgi:hypothetical protein